MKNNLKRLQDYATRFQKELKERGFHAEYKVENIWIDYGADWRDNSIVVYFQDKKGYTDSFQILSPRDIREIKEDKFADQDFYRILDKHVEMFEKYGWGKEKKQLV